MNEIPTQVSDAFRLRNPHLYTATPSSAPTPDGEEGDLHAYVASRLRVLGWLGFHGSMAHATFRTPGEPDFVILAPRGRLLLVELKTKTSKQTTDQLGVAAWAERLGHRVYVVRSEEAFETAVKGIQE